MTARRIEQDSLGPVNVAGDGRSTMSLRGADLVVRHLEAQGVRHVFGVPGAKIDRVFDALLDSRIRTVVCRHEQNASFIAQGIGRLTGKAGVCLVTSGPGTTNLVTGFATATSEGSPVVGLGGVVPRAVRLKQTHQSLDTARPVPQPARRPLAMPETAAFLQADLGQDPSRDLDVVERGRRRTGQAEHPNEPIPTHPDAKG
jgi:hypothetical protein